MTAKAGWIDFRALCKSVEFTKVLDLYDVELKVKGDHAQGFCPLPMHRGQRRSPSFSVHLRKGIWQCFGCSAKGNVIDFVARMEGLDPFKGKDVRKAAEMLQQKLGLPETSTPRTAKMISTREQAEASRSEELPVVVNAPLDFELKNIDPAHPYLLQRGFTAKTIREFGLGFCNRGMLSGRVVIPIHDPTAQLVGYAGRLVDDRAINEEHPKYKLPPPRERNGKVYEFRKSLLLYNVHRIVSRVSDLIVVEGFTSVWWLWQHGFSNVTALMGSSCSKEQAEAILQKVDFDGRIWLMPDGNEPGAQCASSLLEQLAAYRLVRWVKLKPDEQPTDCTGEDLQALLNP